jgi:hypothetical protein
LQQEVDRLKERLALVTKPAEPAGFSIAGLARGIQSSGQLVAQLTAENEQIRVCGPNTWHGSSRGKEVKRASALPFLLQSEYDDAVMQVKAMRQNLMEQVLYWPVVVAHSRSRACHMGRAMSSNATAWYAVQFETNQRLQAQVDELQGQLPGQQGAAAPDDDDMAQQVCALLYQ